MNLHDCPQNLDLLAAPPDLLAIADKITFSPNPNKATIKPDGSIVVDPVYWDSLPGLARKALLHHEMAHRQRSGCAGSCADKPAGCERCADNRLGAAMALEGHSLDEIKGAVTALRIQSRNTVVRDALAGAKLAIKQKPVGATTRTSTPDNYGNQYKAPPPVTATPAETPATDKPPPPSRFPTTPPEKQFPNPGKTSACACDKSWEWIVGAAGLTVAVVAIAVEWLSEK